MSTNRRYDPYGSCTDGCNHDLAPGVLVSELLAGDGPSPSLQLLFGLGRSTAVVLEPLGAPGAADSAA